VRLAQVGLLATIAIVASAAIGPMPAYAQQQQDPLRAKGDRACNGDAKKLCSKFFGQGDMVMLSCFQQNAPRLSGSCRSFLIEVGQLQR
jgi:hypothetical protein